jgi:MFS family permease
MKGENLGERTFRGWYVVAACFMFMVVSAGIGWNAFPVFIKPLEVEFGWTRTQLNGAVGVWALVTGLVSPLLGHWLDRIGERRIMTAGVIVAGLSALAMGWVHSLTQLYVIIIFSAIGTASTTYLPVASIISRWFVKRRGLAMSIAMMGMGVGGFIVPNVASVLIDQVGWRWTYHIFGITILVLLTPVGLLWLRDAPSTPENGDAPSENGNDSPNEGLSVREALRTRNFWGIGLADMLEGMALVGIMTNMVVFSIDAGISAGAAAFGFSLVMGATGSIAAS